MNTTSSEILSAYFDERNPHLIAKVYVEGRGEPQYLPAFNILEPNGSTTLVIPTLTDEHGKALCTFTMTHVFSRVRFEAGAQDYLAAIDLLLKLAKKKTLSAPDRTNLLTAISKRRIEDKGKLKRAPLLRRMFLATVSNLVDRWLP